MGKGKQGRSAAAWSSALRATQMIMRSLRFQTHISVRCHAHVADKYAALDNSKGFCTHTSKVHSPRFALNEVIKTTAHEHKKEIKTDSIKQGLCNAGWYYFSYGSELMDTTCSKRDPMRHPLNHSFSTTDIITGWRKSPLSPQFIPSKTSLMYNL